MDAINDDMRKEGAIVPKKEGMNAFLSAQGLGEFMSFDPTTKEGGKLYIAATLTDVDPLESLANMDITVCNFYAQDVRKARDNGEIEEWTRIVVFNEDGKPYSCGSLGVRKCLGIMFRVRGEMPWNPGVKCRVKVRRLENKNNWMTLEPDMDSLYPEHARKKK